MDNIFWDYASCQQCSREESMWSNKDSQKLKSRTKSSNQVVIRNVKTLSRCTLSPTVLSKKSKESSRRCLSALRLPLVPSLLSSSGLLCWLLVFSVVAQCQGQDVAEHRNTETDTVDVSMQTN